MSDKVGSASKPQTLALQQALDLAVKNHNAGDLLKAESIYNQILEADPNQPQALHLLGVIAHQRGDNQKSVGLIEKVLSINPDFAEAHINLGLALHEVERLDDAVEHYRKALILKPDFAEAHNNLGITLLKLGQLNEALANCVTALELKPYFPEAHNNLGATLLELGKLDDALVEFTKALALKPNYAEAQYNLGNVHRKVGKLEEAVTSYKNALALSPDFAEAHSNLGVTYKELGRFSEALESGEKATELKPKFAEAHNNLGSTLKELRRLNDAKVSFKRAIEIKPEFAEAHGNLGVILQELGQVDEALLSHKKALDLKPNYAEAYSNLGNVYIELGQLEMAVASYHRAIDLEPDFAEVHVNLSRTLLLDEDYEKGWQEYEWRWRNSNFRATWRDFSYPLFSGESLNNKTILVWGEQGIGDEIMFAHAIPDLLAEGAKLVLECSQRLVPVFLRSFEDATIVARAIPPDKQIEEAQIDCQIPIASLCSFYRNTKSSFDTGFKSYLTADPQRTSDLRTRYKGLGDGPVVGICWRSGSAFAGSKRSAPLVLWKQILIETNCSFVSLQYGDVGAELADFKKSTGIELFQDSNVEPLENAEDWFAQVAAMDLVISIDNSTIQVAGSLGIPTWALLSHVPEWQYGMKRKIHIWHSSIQLYRQSAIGDWQSVFSKVSTDFVNWLRNAS